MFGIGIQEAILILAVALLVLGPAKLPGVARSLGKGLRELRKTSDELRSALMFDDEESPKRRPLPPPPVADAPVVGAEVANASPGAHGIHGSLAASAGVVEDDPVAMPVDKDTIVSRGQSGGDPHKRALDPPPRPFDDEAPRHEPFSGADTASVPDDPEATALLEAARPERRAGDDERRAPADEKDAIP